MSSVKIPGQQRAGSPLDDLYARPGFLVRRLNQLLMSIAEQETARIGLTPPQHVCLIALHRCHGLDQVTLGKALGADRATIGQVIRRLEARGLVTRAVSETDARRKLVHLTPLGERMVTAANDAALTVSERLMQPLEADEREQFIRLLSKCVSTLNIGSSIPIEPPETQGAG